MAVFDDLGGNAALLKWARKNQTEYYKICSKLIPSETVVSRAEGGPIRVTFGGRYK